MDHQTAYHNETDLFLGKPIGFWIELSAEIEKRGQNFDTILAEALLAKRTADKRIQRMCADFQKIQNLLAEHAWDDFR